MTEEERYGTLLMTYKMDVGVPQRMISCHTGVAEGYVLEGHVPTAEILAGMIVVPGMVYWHLSSMRDWICVTASGLSHSAGPARRPRSRPAQSIRIVVGRATTAKASIARMSSARYMSRCRMPISP